MTIVDNTLKLKNIYNGDIVYTKEYDKVQESGGIKFIRVYNNNNPQRLFLENREAYIKVV